jgi:hypothetical protein
MEMATRLATFWRPYAMKFKSDIFRFLGKLRKGDNFAFTRFSDGEILIMQNKELVLRSDYVKTGETIHNFGYSSDDHKHFDPAEHGFLKDKLVEAYTFKKDNYFVGGICRNCDCASQEYALWMHEKYGELDANYTYANLLVNSNYPIFIGYLYKELKKKKIVLVCSENADLTHTGLEIVKDFRVGKNCIVNDHHLIDEIKSWIKNDNIRDHVFLFAASSLSEVLIYELFKDHDNNTYIDIGTTLHKQLGLSLERDYLRGYWQNAPTSDLWRSCDD